MNKLGGLFWCFSTSSKEEIEEGLLSSSFDITVRVCVSVCHSECIFYI